MNCKLALARMGNRKYEEEILKEYKKINLDCNQDDLYISVNNLFYINTRASINQVIQYSKENRSYKYEHPDAYKGIINPPCMVKSVILLYLSLVIDNYPLKYDDEADKFLIYMNPRLIRTFNDIVFYKSQEKTMEEWLRQNMLNYQINTEKFF